MKSDQRMKEFVQVINIQDLKRLVGDDTIYVFCLRQSDMYRPNSCGEKCGQRTDATVGDKTMM